MRPGSRTNSTSTVRGLPSFSAEAFKAPPTTPACCTEYRASTRCATPVWLPRAIEWSSNFLLYRRTKITKILETSAASVLRDHDPFTTPIRQTDVRPPVQHEGLDCKDPGQCRPAHTCFLNRKLRQGIGTASPFKLIRGRQQR